MNGSQIQTTTLTLRDIPEPMLRLTLKVLDRLFPSIAFRKPDELTHPNVALQLAMHHGQQTVVDEFRKAAKHLVEETPHA